MKKKLFLVSSFMLLAAILYLPQETGAFLEEQVHDQKTKEYPGNQEQFYVPDDIIIKFHPESPERGPFRCPGMAC